MVTFLLLSKSSREKWPEKHIFDSLGISLLLDFLLLYAIVVYAQRFIEI